MRRIGGLVVVALLSAAVPSAPVSGDGALDFPPPTFNWLDTVNRYRAQSGVAPVTAEPAWIQGQIDHLQYLANTPASQKGGHYANAHTQNPQSRWHTPEGALAAQSGNITYGVGSERDAIDSWMTAPFHAIGILRRHLTRSAFASSNGTAMFDTLRGLGAPVPLGAPVLFPGPGATTYLTSFKGESPDPREGCAADWKAFQGLPIFAMLPTPPVLGVTASLTLPNGTTLPKGNDLCVHTASSFNSSDAVYGATGKSILAGDNAVLVMPRAALTPGEHTVRISQAGVGDVTWSFKVVAAPTAPTQTRALWAGSNRAVVWWQPPASDGGLAISRYSRLPVSGQGPGSPLGDPSLRVAVLDVDPQDVGRPRGDITLAAVNGVGLGVPATIPWSLPNLPGFGRGTNIGAVLTGAAAGTSAVLVNLAMVDAFLPGYVTADDCATMRDEPQSKASGNHGVTTAVANLAVVPVDSMGLFCLYNQVPTHLIVDVQGHFAPGGALRFTSVTPKRLLDTRDTGDAPAAGSIVRVETGLGGQVSAVLVNLAMVDAPSEGYITADKCSKLKPGPQTKANGNHSFRAAVSNLAVVALDPDGSFCVFTQKGAQLIADLQGTFAPAGELRFDAAAPRRVLDTRSGGATAPPGTGAITVVNTGLPATARAALVNIAMVEGAAPGYITADLCSALTPGPQSKASGNHGPFAAVANLAVVPVAADGAFCIFTQSPVHLIVDVQGSFAANGALGFDPVAPVRVLDTRIR